MKTLRTMLSSMERRTPTLLCVALTLAMAAGSPALAAPDALARIQARGRVVIAHREASIPLSYVVDGKPMGYSVDVCHKIVEALARHLKVRDLKVDYLQVTSSNRFEVLETGQADLECGSTTNTAARRERVAFTIPHFIAASRILVLSRKPYERIEDLNGMAVASTAGTTNIDSLANEARIKTISIQVKPAKDHAEGFAWVQSGQVEGFAMDDVLLYGLRASAARPQDFKVIGKPITIEPYAVAFGRDDTAFKAVVDAELRRLIASKELHRLYDKWFNQPIPPKGINLEMRMPSLLVDSFKYPSDFVPN